MRRIAELMLRPRPTIGLAVTMTSLTARVAAAIAGEDPELTLPLMEGLEGDLLPAADHAAELLDVRAALLRRRRRARVGRMGGGGAAGGEMSVVSLSAHIPLPPRRCGRRSWNPRRLGEWVTFTAPCIMPTRPAARGVRDGPAGPSARGQPRRHWRLVECPPRNRPCGRVADRRALARARNTR